MARRAFCAARGYTCHASSRWPTGASTCSPMLGPPPQVVFSTHFDCVPPFFPSRRGARPDVRARSRAMRRASWRRRWRPPSGCARRGETRFALLFVVGEERGSDGARVANEHAPAGVRFLINGEPTDNRLGAATRGMLRVRLRAQRPRRALVVSRARRVGDRQAARRADGDSRRAAARRSAARTDALHGRADRRRRRAERRVAARVGGAAVPHRRRRRAGPRRAAASSKAWSRSSTCSTFPPCGCTPCRGSRPRCSRTPPTCRC